MIKAMTIVVLVAMLLIAFIPHHTKRCPKCGGRHLSKSKKNNIIRWFCEDCYHRFYE